MFDTANRYRIIELVRIVQFLSLIAVTSLVGCRIEIGPPVITKIVGQTNVVALDSSYFECQVGVPAIGPLRFEWWGSRGRWARNDLPRVVWYAPESSGAALIRVKVTDGKGRETVDSLEVSITSRKVVFIRWEGMVKAGEWLFFADSCRVNYRLYGRASADTGSMYLIFLNMENFVRWCNNESYEFRIRRRANDVRPFYDTISESDFYYLILDNTLSSRDCGYQVNIELESP